METTGSGYVERAILRAGCGAGMISHGDPRDAILVALVATNMPERPVDGGKQGGLTPAAVLLDSKRTGRALNAPSRS